MSLAAVVWVDRWHALVARRVDGRPAIVEVTREADPEPAYLRRVAEEAHDCPRLIVLGPDEDRLAFDRQYETLFVRPDRFVEVEACPRCSSSELLDRLRFIEGDGSADPAARP